jgi:hypothetical protein
MNWLSGKRRSDAFPDIPKSMLGTRLSLSIFFEGPEFEVALQGRVEKLLWNKLGEPIALFRARDSCNA